MIVVLRKQEYPATRRRGVTGLALFLSVGCILLVSLVMQSIRAEAQTIAQPDSQFKDGANDVYCIKKYRMTIVSVGRSLEFVFVPKNAPPIDSIALRSRFRFVINGSYFDGNNLEAGHAGWLKLFGVTIASIRDEAQLSHIVRIDTSSHSTTFIDYTRFDSTASRSTIEFQTGPLVVDNNRVAEKYINASINGLGKYRRSLLATLNGFDLYFISVQEYVSLDDLGAYLLSLSIFSGKRLSVINLDGGSSVALYAKNFPSLSYNGHARLPILLGIK